MENMTNRPCLDMMKAIEIIKGYFTSNGLDSNELVDLLKDSFIGWFSRSMATALFAFCKDADGDWCVLASERGAEAADFIGMWNCPCGYLDFGETTMECAVRECFEETGVKIPIDTLILVGYEDDPIKANRQNVTFRFAAKIDNKLTSDFTFSKEANEGEEVGEIAWVKINDIDKHDWAFNHKERILECFSKIIC